MQISNNVYCDNLFENIEITNKLLPNQYKDYPYLIIKNFLSLQLTNEIAKTVQGDNKTLKKAKVKKEILTGIIQSDVIEKYRKTNIYKLNDRYQNIYDTQFLKYKPAIEEYFSSILTFSTKVQVLEYKKGYFYVKHADDSSEIIDEDGNTIGFKNVASMRKLTTVLFGTNHCEKYSNDKYSFSGGELKFNYLYDKNGKQIVLKPQAGDMIVFPSNPYFSHEVLTVEDGYRLTLVQWHDAII
jgi:SM-20-related protein